MWSVNVLFMLTLRYRTGLDRFFSFLQKSSLLLLLFLFCTGQAYSQVTDTLPIKPEISEPAVQSASSTLNQLEQIPPTPPKDSLSLTQEAKPLLSDSTKAIAADTLQTKKKKKKKKNRRADFPNPKKALLLSAIPGGGQIYNRRWIKATVVMGGAVLLTWNILYTTRQFKRLKKAHFYRVDEDPTTVDEFTVNGVEQISTNSLLLLRNNYNKKKETSYLWMVGFVGLSGIEAFVDAHLRTFDINDDLAMRLKPQLDIPVFGSAIVGMTMEFKLGQSKAPPPRPFFQITTSP